MSEEPVASDESLPAEPQPDSGPGPELGPERDPGPERRRYPSTLGGMFYIGILAATGLGLGVVAVGDWRMGIRWVGGALVAAALVRLVLPARDAGMLAVRHRALDAFMFAGVGVALIALASYIPNQPV